MILRFYRQICGYNDPPLNLLGALLLGVLCLCGCHAAPLDESQQSEPVAIATTTILCVASLVCLALAALGCLCCYGKSSILDYEQHVEYDEHNTNQSHTNEAFSDFSPPTQSTPSVPPGSTTETVSIERLPDLSSRIPGAGHGILQVGAEPTAEAAKPDELKHLKSPRYVFPRDQLNYVDELGNGWFGKILQGEALRLHQGMRKTRVVIKQLRETASPEEQLLFLQEVQPYREVNHPNVLMLLGQCIETIPLLLVLEFAPYGDLKSYLRKNRGMLEEMAQKDVQLRMAHEIISGLLWLHQADFIHIDLAARNCQVCADTSVKIGDYGLALEKYPEDYYITRDGCHAVPIRWLAPEVMEVVGQDVKPKKISKESNVWSFGVVMLELSTGADRPYGTLTDEQVMQQIIVDQEVKLDKPSLNVNYADRWFEIMLFCWMDSHTRPTVKEIHELLSHLKKNTDRVDMDDFEKRWNTLKPANPNHSSSDSSEGSHEVQKPEAVAPQGVASVPLDPLSGAALQSSPLSVQRDTNPRGPPDQTHQVVSVDVNLPAFGESQPEQEEVDDLQKGQEAMRPSEAPVPSIAITLDESVDNNQPAVVDDFIASVTAPQVNATPPAVKVESQPQMFEDSFDAPSPIANGQLSLESERLEDSMLKSDTSSKTLDFFSSAEVEPVEASSPFVTSQTPNVDFNPETSASSAAYDTAMSSVVESNDSTVTFTESFNTMSSNPFSSHTTSSSEPSGFVSAVESTGDHGANGFGDFESSLPSFGTASEGESSMRETPVPGDSTHQSSDLFGNLSQGPFSSPAGGDSTVSFGFDADVDTSNVQDSSLEQNGSDTKDSSLLSFGTITLKDQELHSDGSPSTPSQEELAQGYAEVNSAAKKPFGMTMLTVSSGKKTKSIEILKEDEENGDQSASSDSPVTVDFGDESSNTEQSQLDQSGPNLLDLEVLGTDQGAMVDQVPSTEGFGAFELHMNDEGKDATVVQSSNAGPNLLDFGESGPGLDQGNGPNVSLTAGFGITEDPVAADGEDATVTKPQSLDSDEFGSFEDVSRG